MVGPMFTIWLGDGKKDFDNIVIQNKLINEVKNYFKDRNQNVSINVEKESYSKKQLYPMTVISVENYFLGNKNELIKYFCSFIKKLISSFKDIDSLFIKGEVVDNDISLSYQFRYSSYEDEPYRPSKDVSKYSIFHAGIIRNKLFTIVFDETDSNLLKIFSNVLPEIGAFYVWFKSFGSDVPHLAYIEFRKFTLGRLKHTYIISGDRRVTLYSFRADINSHDEEKIKEKIREKLRQRAFEVISIKNKNENPKS